MRKDEKTKCRDYYVALYYNYISKNNIPIYDVYVPGPKKKYTEELIENSSRSFHVLRMLMSENMKVINENYIREMDDIELTEDRIKNINNHISKIINNIYHVSYDQHDGVYGNQQVYNLHIMLKIKKHNNDNNDNDTNDDSDSDSVSGSDFDDDSDAESDDDDEYVYKKISVGATVPHRMCDSYIIIGDSNDHDNWMGGKIHNYCADVIENSGIGYELTCYLGSNKGLIYPVLFTFLNEIFF